MVDDISAALDSAGLAVSGILPNELMLYGFAVINDSAVLGHQSGSSYYDMQVVDSALTSSNSKVMSCGAAITREANLLTFNLPQFFRSAFIIASLNYEGGVASRYNRIMLEYGTNHDRVEIARAALTGAESRGQSVLIGCYPGFNSQTPTTNRFVIQTYGTQQYICANVLVGVIV